MVEATRRTFVAGTGVLAAGAGLVLPASTTLSVMPVSADPGLLDDASRLNATRVSANLSLNSDDAASILGRAGMDGKPLCIGGARHSMGGQSLPPRDGVAAELADAPIHVDAAARQYTVGAGARWRDVLQALDSHGLSPAVTQSNNDFSVGGAISVNAHGWAVPRGPVGSTVRSLRVMTAGDEILTCSPDENAELFRHVTGGYGLFGAILDAEIEAVPNRLLHAARIRVPASDFAARFVAAVHEPGVNMAYGRLSPARHGFLAEAVLVTHRADVDTAEPVPPMAGPVAATGLVRRVFRAQTGSEQGKRFRWWAETRLVPGEATATRNSLMNLPVSIFAGDDPRRTDILHEYFVPPEALDAFLTACRRIIQASRQDLLNLTLRWVEADRISALAFAPEPRIALVMLFSQRISAVDEADMQAMTRDLIDAALDVGGSFYLPYRLHARRDQLLHAYPRLPDVMAFKRRHDPRLRFRNQMWDFWVAQDL